MTHQTQQIGFEPIFNAQSKILILGSFPSVKSREQQFYYGNKQNRFWKVLQNCLGGDISSIQGKRQLCLQKGIALWDIVACCNIDGSMDVDIKNPTFVNLYEVLGFAPVKAILCNGKTAYNFTKRAYNGDLPIECLPSTSPANGRFDQSVWQTTLQKYLKE